MIKENKITKFLLLLLSIFYLLTMNISTVAANGEEEDGGGRSNVAAAVTSPSTGGGGGGEKPGKNDPDGNNPSGSTGRPGIQFGQGAASSCESYSCSTSTSYSINTEIVIDMYDMYGNGMPGAFNSNILISVLAGTYVYLDVYELKSYTSSVSYSAKRTKLVYSCQEHHWDPCAWTTPKVGGGYDCHGKDIYDDYTQDCGCDHGDVVKGVESVDITSGSDWAACAASASPPAINLQPSYDVIYNDSNDINAEPSNDKYYTAEIITKEKAGNCQETKSEEGTTKSSSESCRFSYNRGKTCINVKNGKVRYLDNDGTCDSDEYAVTSQDGYWKYFIPLNANSAEDFTFILSSSGNKEDTGICQDYIEKYEKYYNFITGSNGESLAGTTKGQAKRMVQDGCYLQTTVTIPVVQKFYNELEDGKTFQGFNFYYKPIDITNPFPNGLTNTSIWYDWLNDNNGQEPDLEDSFDEITYYTTNLNGSEIRADNKTEHYTSWSNMNIDGTSKYITSEGVINRNFRVEKDSFYALGCGPKNTNVNNAFQQTECDR